MTRTEYTAIVDELLRRGPCNLLVFGCGPDSPMWRTLNAGGTTAFIVSTGQLSDAVRGKCTDTLRVDATYWTVLAKNGDDLAAVGSPALVLAAEMDKLYEKIGRAPFVWDVVLVDSPLGHEDWTPGRMQSIATAAQYSDALTTVFVHDCDRPAEQR
jgi:uncharacterized protein (TIGR01627 family)